MVKRVKPHEAGSKAIGIVITLEAWHLDKLAARQIANLAT
jgi:hypothetical protein